MSVVGDQEKLRTKSCALFLKLRFWIPPCAKPAWGERGGTVTKPRGGKEHAQPEWLSLQTAGFAPSRSGALVTRGGCVRAGSESTAPSCLHRGTHAGVEMRCKGQRGHNVKELRHKSPSTTTSPRREPAGNCLCHRRDPQITKPPSPPSPKGRTMGGGLESSPSPPAAPSLPEARALG